jgi:hypothetical protein
MLSVANADSLLGYKDKASWQIICIKNKPKVFGEVSQTDPLLYLGYFFVCRIKIPFSSHSFYIPAI